MLISAHLSPEVEAKIVIVLREYAEAFAWSYEDMPGLDPSLVEHRLVLPRFLPHGQGQSSRN